MITGEERQVSLTLGDRTDESFVFLVASPTGHADKATGITSEIIESFRVGRQMLSEEQMSTLQVGGGLDALVKPIASFRIRDDTSLQIIDATAEEADQHLRKLTADTISGNTVARGTMSISFDNGKTSIDATASYSRSEPLDDFNDGDRMLQANPPPGRRCTVTVRRFKRVVREVCERLELL